MEKLPKDANGKLMCNVEKLGKDVEGFEEAFVKAQPKVKASLVGEIMYHAYLVKQGLEISLSSRALGLRSKNRQTYFFSLINWMLVQFGKYFLGCFNSSTIL